MGTPTSVDYDSPWKAALAQYLPDAIALFFPAVHAEIDWARGYILLDKELQQVTRDADLGRRLADTLVQVWRYDGSDVWVLIHIEVQGQPDATFAQRMFVYYYRIFDRYQRPIMSFAVLADEQEGWRPAHFEQALWGCTIEMRYPVVKLLDWSARAEELAASANPFAVVVQAHLAAQAPRTGAEARSQAKIAVIRGLFARGYERGQVLDLLRLIDWLLALPDDLEAIVWRTLEESEGDEVMPHETFIERRGRLEGQRETVRLIIRTRFGSVPDDVERQIMAADGEELNRMTERMVTADTLAAALSGLAS